MGNTTFILLYKSLVRSHLEYGQSVWSPYLLKHIDLIEGVQRRATKLIHNLKNLPYSERLKRLNLPTLVYRRARGDMIETYKIMHGVIHRRRSRWGRWGTGPITFESAGAPMLKIPLVPQHFFTQKVVHFLLFGNIFKGLNFFSLAALAILFFFHLGIVYIRDRVTILCRSRLYFYTTLRSRINTRTATLILVTLTARGAIFGPSYDLPNY